MGLLGDIFGGGAGSADDPYADILTPAQRNQMQVQGLLAMAGAFAQAGMPSRLPVPFGSALGSAAAALGTGQEAGMKTALENALAAQKVRDLRNTTEFRKKFLIDQQRIYNLLQQWPGGGSGTAAAPGALPAGAGTAGTGTPGAGAGGGGLLSSDFSLGSDTNPDYFTRGLAPKASGGLLDYPEASGGMAAGGALVRPQPFDAGLGTETPTNAFRPGPQGSLYPFKDLGVVPGTSGGGGAPASAAPAASQAAWDASAAEVARLDAAFAAKNPNASPAAKASMHVENVIAANRPERGGSSTAPAELDPGAGGDTSPPAAPTATVPQGGGLLGVAADLRAPIEQNPFARSPSPGDPRGVAPLIRQAFLRQGIDPSIPLRVAQSEGLGTFLGDAGKSGGAFQLYTGGGLGNEFQKQTGLDPLDPKNEAATIDWVAKNVNRTGWSPYHGAARVGIGPRTGLPGGDLPPPDQVIPSGPGAGGNLPITRAQYAPGGAAVPGMPQLAPPSTLPQLAPPGIPGLPGAPSPGPGLPQAGAADPAKMNALIYELARQNAAAEVLGLGNPYGSLLTVLQGSPQYKGMVEAATTAARIAQEEPSKMRVDAAKARLDMIQKLSEQGLTLDKNNNPVEIPGMREMLGRTAGETEAAKERAKSQFTIIDAPVLGPNGQQTTEKMNVYEFNYRRQQTTARGGPPQPGDIIGTPNLNETQKAFAPIIAKAYGEQREAAVSAAQQIKTNNESLRLLDKGLYTGWDANLGLALGRIFGVSGRDPADQVTNTQLFVLQRMQQAAQAVRAQPGSASDKDVAFANRMSIGDITLNADTIREGLEIYNKFNLEKIREHNRDAVNLPASVTAGIRQTVDEPPVYEHRQGNTPGGNTWVRP